MHFFKKYGDKMILVVKGGYRQAGFFLRQCCRMILFPMY